MGVFVHGISPRRFKQVLFRNNKPPTFFLPWGGAWRGCQVSRFHMSLRRRYCCFFVFHRLSYHNFAAPSMYKRTIVITSIGAQTGGPWLRRARRTVDTRRKSRERHITLHHHTPHAPAPNPLVSHLSAGVQGFFFFLIYPVITARQPEKNCGHPIHIRRRFGVGGE